MQFSQQTIYNEKFEMAASEIFIEHDESAMNTEEVDLLENFLQIINDEVDRKKKDFKLIIPDIFYPYVGQMSDSIKKNLSIKVDAASRNQKSIDLMTNIYSDGYGLTVNVKDKHVLSILPENTEFIIIDSDIVGMLAEDMQEILIKYRCIASGVDDYDKIDQLKEAGVKLYSGRFIEKPRSIKVKTISPNKASILSLMASLSDPDVELSKITKLVATDSILSFKILKIINSPIYRGVCEIKSVQDAIVRFGFVNLKKWIIMLSLFSLGDKPTALIKMALQRAIMCSKLAEHLKVKDPDPYYTTGLLSLIDAFLDLSLEKLLGEISISQEIRNAILKGEGHIGQVLGIVKKYQRGDVTFKDPALTKIFIDSVEETNNILATIGL